MRFLRLFHLGFVALHFFSAASHAETPLKPAMEGGLRIALSLEGILVHRLPSEYAPHCASLGIRIRFIEKTKACAP